MVGVDTKWIEAHQAVVQAVMGERTFRAKPPLVDLRSLDADLLIRGARRIILELADAAPADPIFSRVLIVENHTTFLALPQLSGTLAVWGAGYRADELVAALPWLAERDVHYWGDLASASLTASVADCPGCVRCSWIPGPHATTWNSPWRNPPPVDSCRPG